MSPQPVAVFLTFKPNNAASAMSAIHIQTNNNCHRPFLTILLRFAWGTDYYFVSLIGGKISCIILEVINPSHR